MPLSLADFVHRWKIASLNEESGAQSHFIDLCEMLGEKHPAAADSAGQNYAFEKRVTKTSGGHGKADVWLRDHFAWEYKGKHKNLEKAYEQLNNYREALGNPPLMVVCDFDRFEVHTNFTATSKRKYAFDLDDLKLNRPTAQCPLPPLDVLRALFGDYNVLRPDRTDAYVTQEAAKQFSKLASQLEIEERNLNATKEEIAHFLMRMLFCLFADSIGLLPEHVFSKLLQSEDRFQPRRFLRKLKQLFEAMSEQDGIFGVHTIKYFNGGLFDSDSIIELDRADLAILFEVSRNYNWAHISPAIFGTLFERSLDEQRRTLIGAHYTSEEDILHIIEPVIIQPLREQWEAKKLLILEALHEEEAEEAARNSRQARLRTDTRSEKLLAEWIHQLISIRVLDPACGSGNFLYVALRRLLDLWLEARNFASEKRISLVLPGIISPTQLYGIETEFYAHELASVVVWIGFLQWKYEHGVMDDREPILQKLDNIVHQDAILVLNPDGSPRLDADDQPSEPAWPNVDFIISNPPFLGGKLLRSNLGDDYVDALHKLYRDRVSAESDLVVYWFEKARVMLERKHVNAVGLVSTQAIRGGANREVLKKINQTGSIFMAWSDREWVNEGAAVHISMVAFDNGSRSQKFLNGVPVAQIHPDLTSDVNTTIARVLAENAGICFMGTTKVGAFDIDPETARKMLSAPLNPNGRPNSDVVKPWVNASDITRRSRGMFIIDFGTEMTEKEAALYELPFQYIKKHVKKLRQQNNREVYKNRWWIHGEARPELRARMKNLSRYIATPSVSKHRVFVWLSHNILPDHAAFAFVRDDDYFFGILQSSIHEVWALHMGTQLESRPRYTPDSCFDTFPFPWKPGHEPTEDKSPQLRAIAEAARELVRLRDAWLNPPNITQEVEKKRTLTNLYNENPEWLQNLHTELDKAVFAAYGWPATSSKDTILANLMALNQQRADDPAASPDS